MSKFIKQIAVFSAVVLCCVLTAGISVYAATANIDIPAQNAANNEEVKVAVNVTSEENIGTFDLRITYDSSILEYVSGADNGGSGVLQVLNSELTQSNSVSKELVFKALKEGNAQIAVQSASSNVLDMGANPMEIAGGVGNVTVGPNNAPSADNNLTSLVISGIDTEGTNHDVSITPEFSQDITEYKAEVGENIVKLSVAATVSDPSATSKITGVQLQPGDNLTTVTITASDGQVKEYKIYTTKNGGTSGNEVAEQAETLPVPEDLSPVFSEKTGKYIIQTFDAVGVPEGFNITGYNYDNKQIAALTGINGQVTVMCLADDENGTNAALFVYNQSTDSFTLYNSYSYNNKSYIMLTPDKDVSVPEGFEETLVKINGVDTMSWQGGIYSDYKDIFLVYAVSSDGSKGFHLYDSTGGTILIYPAGTDSKNGGDSELQSKYDSLKKQSDEDDFVKLEIIIGYSVLCIILVIYASVLLYKLKKLQPENREGNEETPEEQTDSADGSQELKLDMAMQANEVKTETLANDVNAILDEDVPGESEQKDDEKTEQNAADSVNDETAQNGTGTEETQVTEEDGSSRDEEDLGIVFVDLEEEGKK